MKYCIVAISLFCSVTGSCTLKAGESYASTDRFREALLRQLKVMPPAKCKCPDGYEMRDGSCIQSVESDPQAVCHSGRLVDDLCVTPAFPVLQCPEDHITICKGKDRAESPCCARGETAEKVVRCRDGAEQHDGHCTRILSHELLHECPPGFAFTAHGSRCIKEELGEASPLCIYPDVLSPEGDSCITTVQEGFEYVCPDEYECISYSKKKYKHRSPICSACQKIKEAHPTCGCSEGQDEFEGLCYEAGTRELCQTRRGIPRKQAPPTKKGHPPAKDSYDEPEVDCQPSEVSCTCDHPYILQCDNGSCTCIHRETTPVIPVCRGHTDEDGNCIAQMQKRLLYQCAEGFTCDVTNKKGRCQCVRVMSVEPTTRCAVGKEHEGKCIEVVHEPQLVECPHGYYETCCDETCTCTKTTLAVRELRCSAGAVSIQGECAYVSKPSAGCNAGLLREDKCTEELMVPPICS